MHFLDFLCLPFVLDNISLHCFVEMLFKVNCDSVGCVVVGEFRVGSKNRDSESAGDIFAFLFIREAYDKNVFALPPKRGCMKDLLRLVLQRSFFFKKKGCCIIDMLLRDFQLSLTKISLNHN